MEKAAIRRAALGKRNSFLPQLRAQLSEKIVQNALSLKELGNARCIAAFLPIGDEVDARKLLEKLMSLGKKVCIPVVAEDGSCIRFANLKSFDEGLVAGPHGTLEPVRKNFTDPGQIGIFFVPGLAFDRKGGRLGWGRGYYDRFFSESGARGLRVGLAFGFQVGLRLPVERHDVLMDALVTEKEVLRF